MVIIPIVKKNVCKLCGRPLTDEYSELAYEILGEDGSTTEKIEVGKICIPCADTLDDKDELLGIDD